MRPLTGSEELSVAAVQDLSRNNDNKKCPRRNDGGDLAPVPFNGRER